MKNKPEHISVIIQRMLQDIVKRPFTPICNMTDLTPKNGQLKKNTFKKEVSITILTKMIVLYSKLKIGAVF